VARGRVEYEFVWLLGRPMRAVLDPAAGTLSFPALFPAVKAGSPMVRALAEVVASRTARDLPAHKRMDARRARVSSAVRRGTWTLAVTIRGRNHEYAVRGALNLINELFLVLHERWPEYLIERFGLSPE